MPPCTLHSPRKRSDFIAAIKSNEGTQLMFQKFKPKSLIMALMIGTSAIAFSTSGSAVSRTQIKQIVIEEAQRSTVPPALALAVAKVESDFQERVRSHKGARGVMQIMPATALGEFGVDADELWEPRLNVQLGIDFLERLYAQYGGSWELALSHYNGGTLKGGKGSYAQPHSYTRKYVADVMRWWQRYQDQSEVWGGTQTANANISVDYVAVSSENEEAGFYGDPDPGGTGDIEYKLQAKIEAAHNSPVLAQAPGYKRPVVTWIAPTIITQSPSYTTKNMSGNSFWDRVSKARNTLDDFGTDIRKNKG